MLNFPHDRAANSQYSQDGAVDPVPAYSFASSGASKYSQNRESVSPYPQANTTTSQYSHNSEPDPPYTQSSSAVSPPNSDSLSQFPPNSVVPQYSDEFDSDSDDERFDQL